MKPRLSPAIEAIAEEQLDPGAFDHALARALADEDENERQREHIRWFMRRYPTPDDRLRYARHLYRQWMEGRGPASVAAPAAAVWHVIDTIELRHEWTSRYPRLAARGEGLRVILDPFEAPPGADIVGSTLILRHT